MLFRAGTAGTAVAWHAARMSRLLIVDDEPNQRKLMAMGLRSESFEVFEACDGQEALLFLDGGGQVDLAIVDLMMPGISGLDLARRLRSRAPEVRVLLMSAYHLTAEQVRRADVGAVGFIPKPFDPDELAAFVRAKLEVTQPSARRAPRNGVDERRPVD